MKEFKIKINGNDYNVAIDIDGTNANVEVNGTPYKVEIDKPVAQKSSKIARPAPAPVSETGAPVVNKPTVSANAGAVISPLPGVVLDVHVKEGDTVKMGQKLLVLEAMKMENVIEADRDGRVISLKVGKGSSVLEGAELVIIG